MTVTSSWIKKFKQWLLWLLCCAQQCSTLCNPLNCSLPSPLSRDFPGRNTGVGCRFPTQGSNPPLVGSLPLVPPGDPKQSHEVNWKLLSRVRLFATPWTVQSVEFSRILDWVSYPFSRGSSWNWTGTSCIAGGFFTIWTMRQAQLSYEGSSEIVD